MLKFENIPLEEMGFKMSGTNYHHQPYGGVPDIIAEKACHLVIDKPYTIYNEVQVNQYNF